MKRYLFSWNSILFCELLELTPFQKQAFKVDAVSQLYPEYYILRVNDFNRVAKTPLEEWIYYLNTGEIPSGATASGLEMTLCRKKFVCMPATIIRGEYA